MAPNTKACQDKKEQNRYMRISFGVKSFSFRKLICTIKRVATETIFENICSFLPGASFSGFLPESFMFNEQIFQESCLFADTTFPEGQKCTIFPVLATQIPIYQ